MKSHSDSTGVPTPGQTTSISVPVARLAWVCSDRSGLSPTQVAEFRVALLNKRRELLLDAARMRDEPDLEGPHLYEHTQRLLTQVEEALRRVEAGTYGTCEGTEHRIGMTRLRAIPWARRCFECAMNGDRRP